jgi:nucleoside-diphosphate-sugar epimerase
MIQSNTFLILGGGYVGQALAHSLNQKHISSLVTTRSAEKIDFLAQQGIEAILWDGTLTDTQQFKITHIVQTIPPVSDPFSDPGLEFMERYNWPNLKWVCYLSSTGVYGDHQGAWVDETAQCLTQRAEGHARLCAEDAWRAFARARNSACTILRLSGIYGPRQNAFVSIRGGHAQLIDKPNHFISRIHRDDVIQVILKDATLSTSKAFKVYNVADDLPAPTLDVYRYAYKLMDQAPSEALSYTQVQDAMPLSRRRFYEESRRILNSKMKIDLGITLHYPDYKKGLEALFEQRDGA